MPSVSLLRGSVASSDAMMAQVLAPRLEAAIAELRERPISGTEKGFGVPAPGAVVSAADLAARRPSLFGPGFTMPVLVLREPAVAHNVSAMAIQAGAARVSGGRYALDIDPSEPRSRSRQPLNPELKLIY